MVKCLPYTCKCTSPQEINTNACCVTIDWTFEMQNQKQNSRSSAELSKTGLKFLTASNCLRVRETGAFATNNVALECILALSERLKVEVTVTSPTSRHSVILQP